MKNLLFILCFLPALAFGQKRIDQLPVITTPVDTDLAILVRGGSAWNATMANISSYLSVSSGAIETDTLSASGETSMRIKYTGSTAPTLTKSAAGEYLLTIATGTDIKSFVWYESGATFTSGSIKLTIRDADGETLYGNYTVLQGSTGDEIGQLAGIVIRQTAPLAGDALVQFPNMSSISGDFIIIGTLF